MAPSNPNGPQYNKDEKVLCFHLELLYEAKVLDYKPKDPNDKRDGFLYRVHYKGWKNTWDDWVPGERIRKLNDENRELASNLKKDHDAQRRAASGKPSIASTTGKRRGLGSDAPGSSARGSEDRSSAAPPPPPRGTKRAREIEGIDKEENFISRPAVKIELPSTLKSILVDDWEKVTKDNRIVSLPHPAPITKFLNLYEAEELRKEDRHPGSAGADILEEVIAGVREYFNKAVGRILLYRFERQQFQEWHKELQKGSGEYAGMTFCDIYGCEHLLRLFVSMPDLIVHTNMDSQAIRALRTELVKMTTYLAKHVDAYLSHDYEHVGPDYQANSGLV
nr:hypothetical protein B0A51_17926 [Rachicladosporium sp. CCFEE 5018]